jgi:tRNA(Ile)-lysidine synthase
MRICRTGRSDDLKKDRSIRDLFSKKAGLRRKLHKIVLLHVLEQFLNHLRSIANVKQSDRFLLAVSGGIDSMVMLDLFRRAGLEIGVAHCNFQLRPEEACREQQLVEQTCSRHGIPYFSRRFDTREFATSQDLSIQVAARELRYQFFNEQLHSHRYNWVATAHHLNDSIETILLNFVRGTGLEGLTGIPLVNGTTIRPLLCFTRMEIESYAGQNAVLFQHDSSNFSNDYSRNLLRNQVIPVLRQINPGLEGTSRLTIERLSASRMLIDDVVDGIRSAARIENGRTHYPKDLLATSKAPALLLWKLLKQFDFSYDQCRKIVKADQTGKWFSSRTHRLLVDRSDYIVEKVNDQIRQARILTEEEMSACMNGQMLEIAFSNAPEIPFERDDNVAFLDADRITFPITWRYWNPGDSFVPLGMGNNTKKVSDFLIDRKVDRLAKEITTVLESSGEIFWVVGHRISDKVKISPSTRRMLVVRWSKANNGEVDKSHSN